jgi:ureidoacrylate peracid hydrolase
MQRNAADGLFAKLSNNRPKEAYMEPVLTDLADKVNISHTAVLFVDMQNVYCAEGYPEGVQIDKTAIRSMIPRLKKFLTEARKRKVTIVFVGTVMNENDFSPPIRELCIRHYGKEVAYCMRGSWEAEFIPEIQPEAQDIIIEKTRYSAFSRNDLDSRLRGLGITTLIVTGVGTNVCVETTCRDGFMRDYYIVVPNDLVATIDSSLHDGSLTNLDRYFARVTSSAELLKLWE